VAAVVIVAAVVVVVLLSRVDDWELSILFCEITNLRRFIGAAFLNTKHALELVIGSL